MDILLLNGEPQRLDLNHRALSFGDGLFETCYLQRGKIEFFQQHLKRLMLGAQRLSLKYDRQQQAALVEQIHTLTADIDSPHILKIMLLRHASGRGYDYDPLLQSIDTVVQLMPYQALTWLHTGVSVHVGDDAISENRLLKNIKHLNRLDSVIARQSARKNGKQEAIMCDQNGFYVEGSMSNLFICIDNTWSTPQLRNSGVDGVVRKAILAKHSDILERDVSRDDLQQCQSAFICNSLIGVVDVIDINDRTLQPNRLTNILREELFNRD